MFILFFFFRLKVWHLPVGYTSNMALINVSTTRSWNQSMDVFTTETTTEKVKTVRRPQPSKLLRSYTH